MRTDAVLHIKPIESRVSKHKRRGDAICTHLHSTIKRTCVNLHTSTHHTQLSKVVSISTHLHITSNHRRGDTHASTRRSTRCSTDSAVVVDHPEQSTHAPVTTMSCDGAACGAQHRVHPHRQSRHFPTPSSLRSSTSPHPCTRTELRRVRTPTRDQPSNHPRWGMQCLACHQMSKVDSPSFYQGVYSAVVFPETKNNNNMHTLCRNVQSTASASRRQLRAERASKCRLVGEPREALSVPSALHAEASAASSDQSECPGTSLPPHPNTQAKSMVETNKQPRARRTACMHKYKSTTARAPPWTREHPCLPFCSPNRALLLTAIHAALRPTRVA